AHFSLCFNSTSRGTTACHFSLFFSPPKTLSIQLLHSFRRQKLFHVWLPFAVFNFDSKGTSQVASNHCIIQSLLVFLCCSSFSYVFHFPSFLPLTMALAQIILE